MKLDPADLLFWTCEILNIVLRNYVHLERDDLSTSSVLLHIVALLAVAWRIRDCARRSSKQALALLLLVWQLRIGVDPFGV